MPEGSTALAGQGLSAADDTPAPAERKTRRRRWRIGRIVKPIHLVGLCILLALWILNRETLPFLPTVSLPTYNFIETLRLRTFDLYQRIQPRAPGQQMAPVVIIDIDDRSLERLGQWPWPRTTLAKLVDQLQAYGVGVVGFDVFFPEYDRTNPTLVVQNIPDLDPQLASSLASLPAPEAYFAEAMSDFRVVLGQANQAEEVDYEGEVPRRFQFSQLGIASEYRPGDYLEQYPGSVLRNVPELENAASGLGMVMVPQESDGVVRRVGMAVSVQDEIYPALTLDMLRIALGSEGIILKSDRRNYQNFVIIQSPRGNFPIPTDDKFRVWVHYRGTDLGQKGTDESIYISVVDVLEGTVPPERLQGAFALIGTSAQGLKDLRNTPIDPFLPGVEVHAQLLEMILSNSYLQRPQYLQLWENVAILAVGLLMIVLVPLLGAAYTLIFSALVIAAMIGTSWYAYAEMDMLVDGLYPALTALVMYVSLSYMNYAREEAQKKQVRGAFSRYMSPALVERLADDPSQLKLGGEMKDMSLLFCDIRGFTTISEQFDPEGLTRFINRFLTPMTDVILQRQGTIDKYMGDCIMAFWNAPLDDPNHAANACDSALAMIGACLDLNELVKAEAEEAGRKHVEVRIGIGINTDTVCVGNMGSDQRFDYSVLGDGVNLAARLEGQSKTYGVTVVIGEGTVTRAPDFATIELDLIQVKGKTEPVRIFALLGDRELAKDPDFIAFEKEHAAYLQAYRDQRFTEALEMSKALRERARRYNCEGFYDLFDERINIFLEAPPEEGWTGVFIATTK